MLSSWPTLIGKSKSFLPKQSTFFELLGFVVLAVGIFCGLALLTYDPSDLTQVAATGETYQNMGGPGGARLADLLLGTLGIGSLLIAPMLCLCGALMALGFIRWPKAKRFVGFALIVVVFAGLTHIEQPDPDATHLPHGVGGVIGTLLGNSVSGDLPRYLDGQAFVEHDFSSRVRARVGVIASNDSVSVSDPNAPEDRPRSGEQQETTRIAH